MQLLDGRFCAAHFERDVAELQRAVAEKHPQCCVETASVEEMCNLLKGKEELPLASPVTLGPILLPMWCTAFGQTRYVDFLDLFLNGILDENCCLEYCGCSVNVRGKTAVCAVLGCTLNSAPDSLRLYWIINTRTQKGRRLAEFWGRRMYRQDTWREAVQDAPGLSHEKCRAWSRYHRPAALKFGPAKPPPPAPVPVASPLPFKTRPFEPTYTMREVLLFLHHELHHPRGVAMDLAAMNAALLLDYGPVVGYLEDYMWYNRSDTEVTATEVDEAKQRLRAAGHHAVLHALFDPRVYGWYIIPYQNDRVVLQSDDDLELGDAYPDTTAHLRPSLDHSFWAPANPTLEDRALIACLAEMESHIMNRTLERLQHTEARSGLSLANEITYVYQGTTYDINGAYWWNMLPLCFNCSLDASPILRNVNWDPVAADWDVNLTKLTENGQCALMVALIRNPMFVHHISEAVAAAFPDTVSKMLETLEDQSVLGTPGLSRCVRAWAVKYNPEFIAHMHRPGPQLQMAVVKKNPRLIDFIETPHESVIHYILESHPYLLFHLSHTKKVTQQQKVDVLKEHPHLIEDFEHEETLLMELTKDAAGRAALSFCSTKLPECVQQAISNH